MNELHSMCTLKHESRALEWLLAGDPSIRWQTFCDLADALPETVTRERARVVGEGWGKRLLELQDPEGTWAGGLYTPKWTSTTYTVLLLRDLGLSPGNEQAVSACALLLDRGFYHDGGIGFGWGRSEACVTGMVLSILAYFRLDDDRLDRIAKHLLERQMTDGGWNCRQPFGAVHGSVHTTISVLEGLADYERFRGRNPRRLKAARRRGRDFQRHHCRKASSCHWRTVLGFINSATNFHPPQTLDSKTQSSRKAGLNRGRGCFFCRVLSL